MAYGTNQGFEAWLASQGLELPLGANLDVLRSIGSSYLDSAYEWRLNCSHRTGGFEQELAWPRTGQVVNGQVVPDDLIPAGWVNASYRAAYLQATQAGWATTGIDSARQTKREKVEGAVEVEYFAAADAAGSDVAAGMPSDSIINGMVSMWLCSKARRLNDLFRVI